MTAAANWMMTELYAHDVRRHDEAKMPRMGRQGDLYPEARRRFPGLAPQTVASLATDDAGRVSRRPLPGDLD